MNFDWQNVVPPAIVLIAVAYLVRITWKKWFGKPKPGQAAGCGSCGSCPSASLSVRSEPHVIDISPMITKK